MGRKSKRKEKKDKSNKFIRVFSKILIIIILIVAILSVVFLSGIFSIKEVEVSIDGENQDGENISIEEIQNLSGLNIGQNVFEVSKGKIKTNIKANPYIQDISVSKGLNGKIKIDVTTRVIKYLINYAGAYIYLDESGNVLELSTELIDYPVLLGTTTDFTELEMEENIATTKLNDEDCSKLTTANNIMETAKSNDVDALITRIDISDSKEYIVYLDSERKIVYLGDCSDLTTRILYMKNIIKQEAGVEGEIFIDGDLNSSYVYFRESV